MSNLSDPTFLRSQLETWEAHSNSGFALHQPFTAGLSLAVNAAFDNYGPLLAAVLDVLALLDDEECHDDTDDAIDLAINDIIAKVRDALARASQPGETKP